MQNDCLARLNSVALSLFLGVGQCRGYRVLTTSLLEWTRSFWFDSQPASQ